MGEEGDLGEYCVGDGSIPLQYTLAVGMYE